MNNITPQHQPCGSMLIEGARDCNVSHFGLSVVCASIAKASLGRLLFLTDSEPDGRDLVARAGGWLDNYFRGRADGEASAAHKRKTLAYHYNVLGMKPGATANRLLESEPAVSPFWLVRDDTANSMPSAVAHWHAYATAIRERLRCNMVHLVKRDTMQTLAVDPANYESHWELNQYFPRSHNERLGDAMLLVQHDTGTRTIWRDKAQSGSVSIYYPSLDEEIVA